MMVHVERTLVGFHGKLPGLGDFVQRRLPVAFVEAWDCSFRVALDGVAARLGEDWRSCVLDAPLWRFALATHVVGPQSWVGAVASSSDRVGRVFPLVLAVSPGRTVDGWPELPAATWFERLEAVLREGREQGSLPGFDRAVCAIPEPTSTSTDAFAPPVGNITARSVWWRGADPRRGVLLPGLPGVADYQRFIDGIEAGNHEESA